MPGYLSIQEKLKVPSKQKTSEWSQEFEGGNRLCEYDHRVDLKKCRTNKDCSCIIYLK